ncbi:transcriptional repressor CTCFL-like [Tetranychus urticae]|uniref:C2H2-type domain-containing protein n=1 Tax=Tetranychus urticae TaxID=32264 RepID=T1L4D5_TETUR|nr:transcriptional repressor CTCFL-like [Tetranychus urticae]
MWNYQPYASPSSVDYKVTCTCITLNCITTSSILNKPPLIVPSQPEPELITNVTNVKTRKRFKRYKCPTCIYECTERGKLTRHQRMHAGHKPFKCPSCQYESYDKSKIRRHYVTHTRDKPFQCELCGSRFTQSGSLKTHLANVHKMEKVEFLCPFCTKLVTQNMGELRNHIKTLHHSTNYPVIVNKAYKTG